VLALTIGLVATACSGDDGRDPEDVVALPRRGPVTAVDVCRLLPAEDVSALVGHPVSVVEGQYLSATLPTYRCGFGTTFGSAQVRVSLAPGPVVLPVFDEAYGEAAGGDPLPVERLGQRAYLRNEGGVRSLVVLSRGAILQVTAPPALRPRRLVDLTTRAVERLPGNPVLDVPESGQPCTDLPPRVVQAALDVPIELGTTLVGPDGAVVCSWAGLPGSVTVTVRVSPADHQAAERQQHREDGVQVNELDRARGWSAADRPGDLVVLVGPSTVIRIDVVPAPGWASDDIPTTSAEVALANAVVDMLT
jgi:hypothetical protein